MKFKTVYLWFTLPVVCVVLWVFLFYLPVVKSSREYKLDNAASRDEANRVEAEVRAKMALGIKEKTTKNELAKVALQLPRVDEFSQFLKEVVLTARALGVTIEGLNASATQQALTDNPLLFLQPVEIDLKGRYLEIGRFIEELERKSAYGSIRRAKLAYDEKEYPILRGTVLFEWKTLKGVPSLD